MTASATTKTLSDAGTRCPSNGEHAQREGDVRRHRDADAGLRRRPGVEREVDQRRHHHAAERRDDRQQRVAEASRARRCRARARARGRSSRKKTAISAVVDPVLEAEAADLRLPEAEVPAPSGELVIASESSVQKISRMPLDFSESKKA